MYGIEHSDIPLLMGLRAAANRQVSKPAYIIFSCDRQEREAAGAT
jgi:hypothetical protein